MTKYVSPTSVKYSEIKSNDVYTITRVMPVNEHCFKCFGEDALENKVILYSSGDLQNYITENIDLSKKMGVMNMFEMKFKFSKVKKDLIIH